MRQLFIKLFHRFGLTPLEDPQRLFTDMDPAFRQIYRKTKAYTMTSTERMFGLYKAVEYISKQRIPGDIVECGVWRGGSSMIAAYTLKNMRDTSRKIYMYDTYAGMVEPDARDRTMFGNTSAHDIWTKSKQGINNSWCFADITDVQKNMFRTKYPQNKLVFVKGKVEDTIPIRIPKHISLLRLDTDWYASTYHELMYLFPRLVKGGVLIIDDYGHWKGARSAVDTYMKKHKITLLFHRLDYTGRIAIKTTS